VTAADRCDRPLAAPGIFALEMPCGHVNPSALAGVREWRWLGRGKGAAPSDSSFLDRGDFWVF